LNRLTALRAQFTTDALLVTKDENIRYLTNFNASESWLLVTRKKAFYITDFRYVLEAKKGLKGIPIKQYQGSIVGKLFELCKLERVKTLGFDETQFSVAQHRILKNGSPKRIKLIPANGQVEDFRQCKDVKEVSAIKKALALHHQALKFMKRIIRPGASEMDCLLKLENFVKSKGAGFSFDPIIASGPNSCFPHASVTKRKIKNNELVLVDFGIKLNGYMSDLTRMFYLGNISRNILEAHEKVNTAQKNAIAIIKEGVKISEVDFAARGYLAKFNIAKYFGHSLGHGVGLEIHEDPRVAQSNNLKLKQGMVITVEPAVYFPNKFGIRIEDMVLVTKKGCEVLSGNINE